MPGLIINYDLCKGCGLCVYSCPNSALSLQGKKATVNPDICSLCNVCTESCPFDAIKVEKEKYAHTAMPECKDIWVFCEQSGGRVLKVGYELLGKSRELASLRGCRVVALLIGTELADEAGRLIECGADEVLLCESELFKDNPDQPYADIISKLAEERAPETMLFGATRFGRSVAPRVAARLRTGLTADCTMLEIDGKKGVLLQTRPAFGGNLMAAIYTENSRPQMATVRPGVMPAPMPESGRAGVVTRIPPPEALPNAVELIETILIESSESIADANVVVVAGRGIDSMKNMALVRELAELLEGTVGCTRAVVDIGWAEHRCQIGQTGATVSPDLIITCGVSGSIQFLAGIGGAKNIIAINTDPQAPIFGVANYKVVGDCVEILKELISQVKTGKNFFK